MAFKKKGKLAHVALFSSAKKDTPPRGRTPRKSTRTSRQGWSGKSAKKPKTQQQKAKSAHRVAAGAIRRSNLLRAGVSSRGRSVNLTSSLASSIPLGTGRLLSPKAGKPRKIETDRGGGPVPDGGEPRGPGPKHPPVSKKKKEPSAKSRKYGARSLRRKLHPGGILAAVYAAILERKPFEL